MYINVRTGINKLSEEDCYSSSCGHKYLKDAIEGAVRALYERLSDKYFCPDLNTEADWLITRDEKSSDLFTSLVSFIRAGDRVEVRQNFKKGSKLNVSWRVWNIIDYVECDLNSTVQDLYIRISNGVVSRVDISVEPKEKHNSKGFFWAGRPSCVYVEGSKDFKGRNLDISKDRVFYSIHRYLLKPVLESIMSCVGLEGSSMPLELHYNMVESKARVYVPLEDKSKGYAVSGIVSDWLNTYCDMLFRHVVGTFSGEFFANTMEIDCFGDGTFTYWFRA